MHHGYKIVEDMISGLERYLDAHGMRSVEELIGRAVPSFRDWGDLDLNYKVVARIDPERCIGCQMCYVACWDGAHQCIDLPGRAEGEALPAAAQGRRHDSAGEPVPRWRVPKVREEDCIGCNLCSLVCPVPGCIEMVEVETGKPRTTWSEYVAAGADPALLAPRPDESHLKLDPRRRATAAHGG